MFAFCNGKMIGKLHLWELSWISDIRLLKMITDSLKLNVLCIRLCVGLYSWVHSVLLNLRLLHWSLLSISYLCRLPQQLSLPTENPSNRLPVIYGHSGSWAEGLDSLGSDWTFTHWRHGGCTLTGPAGITWFILYWGADYEDRRIYLSQHGLRLLDMKISSCKNEKKIIKKKHL